MAFLKGWVPLYGAGKALPIIQVERSDGEGTFDEQTARWVEFISEQDLSKFPRAYPYTVKNLDAELSGVDEVSSSYKYKVQNSSGNVIGGISDVYRIKAPSGASYSYTITIYGTNAGAGIGSLTSRIFNVAIRDDPSSTFDSLNNLVYYAVRYNPYTTADWDIDLATIYTNSKGSSSNHAHLAASLNDLEWYSDYDEAIRNTFPENPYDPGGNSGPAGGGGHFGTDRPSDSIDIPNGSAANSLADAGIFSHYLMSVSDLKQFGDWLWADNIIESLNKELITLWYGNIFEAIISLFSYPFAPALLKGVKTSPDVVYLGSYNTATPSAGRLTNDFAQIDWGSVNITEYWGNFLDYAPHTKIQLYLPWGTGFVDIDPNEVMNSSIQVVTNIELSKGTCVHNVVNGAGSVLGTYNAFCGAQYPITSKDTSGKAIGAAVAGVSLAISHATGAVAKDSANIAQSSSAHARKQESLGLDSSGMRSVAERASNEAAKYNAISNRAASVSANSAIAAARTPASFNRNGAFSPNAAMLGVQYPYFIMTWPDQSVPSQYGNHVGYPSNMYQSLGRLRGYTEVGAIHLEDINCTEHEREELLSMLQGGVIL